MQSYRSRETVKARKVTDKDGESVVTDRGPVSAAKGDFVVHRTVPTYNTTTGEVDQVQTVSVMDADAFTAAYVSSSGPGRGRGESTRTRKSASKRATAPRKATASKSAAERVKGSQRK